jgi:hypothetical protein
MGSQEMLSFNSRRPQATGLEAIQTLREFSRQQFGPHKHERFFTSEVLARRRLLRPHSVFLSSIVVSEVGALERRELKPVQILTLRLFARQ